MGAARNGAIGAAVIGLMTCVVGSMAAGPAAIFDGLFFLLAAVGIRQLSFPASAMAVSFYIAGQVAAMTLGRAPGVIGLALSLLLVGAARASWHALRMNAQDRAAMANDSPLETWTQQALTRMGSPFWRKIRIVFNVVLLLYFLLLMTGLAFVVAGIKPE